MRIKKVDQAIRKILNFFRKIFKIKPNSLDLGSGTGILQKSYQNFQKL